MGDLARQLVRNTLFNFLGRFVSRLANFFLVPYILYKIGVKDFGLFSLLNVFFYFASLADLGTGAALVRFMAQDVARRDMECLGRRVFGQLLFCFAVTVALAVTLHVLGNFFLSFFRLPNTDLERMHFLVVPFIIAMGMGCMSNVFQSVLWGYQRMDLTNVLGIFLVLPNVAGTILLLKAGLGLEGLVWVFLTVQCLGLVMAFFLVGRFCPGLRWARFWPDKQGFLETVRLGLQVQWMRIVSTLSKTFDQILLAPMMGLTAVTVYSLASKPVLLVQEAGSLILSATLPAVAHLDSRNSTADKQRMDKLLAVSQRYLNLFVGVSIGGFWLLSGFLVDCWLGPGYENVAQIARILAFGHLFWLLSAPGTNELVGRADMSILTPILTVQMIGHIVLCWWAIKTIGLVGPAAALCVATTYGTIHFLIAFYRRRSSTPRHDPQSTSVVQLAER